MVPARSPRQPRPATAVNAVRYWRTPLMDGDLLTARYHKHAFGPHWHDAYTIPVIEAGLETYQYRGSRHLAGSGSMPVINPGEVHTGSGATDAGWRYRVFYPSVEYLRRLSAELTGRSDTPWFGSDVIEDPDLAVRLTHAHLLLEQNAAALQTESALLDAFGVLIARHALAPRLSSPPTRDTARVAAMQARLADDLAETLTLTELAAGVGLSPFYAARLFTRSVGQAPHAWRNQLRLNRSLGALRAGQPVTQVAAASGFTDQSHFTRHFLRTFGVPPGRWQASLANASLSVSTTAGVGSKR